MKNLQRYLQDVANARRRELLPYMFHVTNAQVQTGPFKDLYLIPQYMWGDGDTAAKLMGIYEDELHDSIEDAIKNQPDVVINVGCAEGYYSAGLAKRLPTTMVYAVDIEPKSLEIVSNVKTANGLNNLVPITKLVDTSWLEEQTKNYQKPLLVFDCEGAEMQLLDPAKVATLSKCSIIVECHDCMGMPITETLISRFTNTHDILKLYQGFKDPYQFDFLSHLSDCDKWCLVHEGRPSTMSWLYLTPKK